MGCVLVATVLAGACGKRGAPLPPIRPVPAQVTDLLARRTGDRIEIGFNIPTENTDGTTPPVISRVEIYAAAGPPAPVTPHPFAIPVLPLWPAPAPPPATPGAAPASVVAPPGPAPLLISRFPPVQLFPTDPSATTATDRRREPPATTAAAIMTRKYLRSEIEVRPPDPVPEGPGEAPAEEPAADEPAPAAPEVDDPRPAPGMRARFSEQVTDELAAAGESPEASVLRYVVVGVAGNSRLGAPSAVLEFPLTSEVAPPGHLSFAYGEANLALAWTPSAPLQSYQVYRSGLDGAEDPRPLNTAPLTVASFTLPVAFDLEQCFTVRAVAPRGAASVESEPAGPLCVTPVDRFAPPAPTGLSALPTETQIQLLWSPVGAADLAGYLVLRSRDGGAPEPITTAPLTDPTFTDSSLEPGVRYTYTVIAVDKAGNRSRPSNAIEEAR